MLNLDPETYTKGGGLLDDATVRILEFGTRIFDFNGKGTPAPVIFAVFGTGDDHTTPVTENYPVGSTRDFIPTTKDGETFVSKFLTKKTINPDTQEEIEEAAVLGMGFDPVGSRSGIHETSKGGMLLASALGAGLDKAKLAGGNIHQALQGALVHVKRQTLPEDRRRAAAKPNADPDAPQDNRPKDPPTVLLIEKILEQPGGGKPAAGAAPAKPKAAPKAKETAAAPAAAPASAVPTAAGDATLEGKLVDAVVTCLALADGNAIKRGKLVPTVFASDDIKADPALRQYASQRLLKDDFLTGHTEWTFDGQALTMGG